MTIRELIESGKGYLEYNEIKLDVENKQFKQIMDWNTNIANGEVREGVAYGENGEKLEWVWVSLEEPVEEEKIEISEEDLKEAEELGLLETTQEEVVEDILIEKKKK